MSEDRSLIDAIWKGQIPVCFKLAKHDCVSSTEPEAFYLMLPRISYLPLFWDQVQRHFVNYVAKENQDGAMWLEYNSTPLRWQNPIGLLYDMLVEDGSLPWRITVNFSGFPQKEIIPCPNRQVVEAHYMQTLKETDFLRTSNKVINAITSSVRRQITAALFGLEGEQFWSVNKKLMITPDTWKYVAVKMFLSKDRTPIQRLVKPNNTDGEPVSLREVICDWIKDFSEEKYDVIIHGVKPPLDASLHWVALNMSYADDFLYVVLKLKGDSN